MKWVRSRIVVAAWEVDSLSLALDYFESPQLLSRHDSLMSTRYQPDGRNSRNFEVRNFKIISKNPAPFLDCCRNKAPGPVGSCITSVFTVSYLIRLWITISSMACCTIDHHRISRTERVINLEKGRLDLDRTRRNTRISLAMQATSNLGWYKPEWFVFRGRVYSEGHGEAEKTRRGWLVSI